MFGAARGDEKRVSVSVWHGPTGTKQEKEDLKKLSETFVILKSNKHISYVCLEVTQKQHISLTTGLGRSTFETKNTHLHLNLNEKQPT